MNEMIYLYQSTQIRFLFKLYAFSYLIVWLMLISVTFYNGNYLLSFLNLFLFSIYTYCHFLPIRLRLFKVIRMLPHALFSFTVYFESRYFNTDLLLSVYLLHILSLGFLYKIDYDKTLIVFLVFLDLVLMLMNFSMYYRPLLQSTDKIPVFLPHAYEFIGIIVATILLLLINSYYQSFLSYRCNELKQFTAHESETSDEISVSKGITAGMSVRLMQLVNSDLAMFYKEFNTVFPDFEVQIRSLAANITDAEMALIKLIKMNLTTKDIALLTNSTLKTIESKKYRIRKKLNISSNAYMNVYFNTHNF